MIIDFLSNISLTEAREGTSTQTLITPTETVKLDFRDILTDIEKPFNIELREKYVDAVKRSDPVNTFISYLNDTLSYNGFNNVFCSFLYHDIVEEKPEYVSPGFLLNIRNLYSNIRNAYFTLPAVCISFFGIKGLDIDLNRYTYYKEFRVQLYNDIYLILEIYPFEAAHYDHIRCDLTLGSASESIHQLPLKEKHISLDRVVDKSNANELVDNFKCSMSAAIRDELDKLVPEKIEIPKEAIGNLAAQLFDYLEEVGVIDIDLF